jgi:hypothetical protein
VGFNVPLTLEITYAKFDRKAIQQLKRQESRNKQAS